MFGLSNEQTYYLVLIPVIAFLMAMVAVRFKAYERSRPAKAAAAEDPIAAFNSQNSPTIRTPIGTKYFVQLEVKKPRSGGGVDWVFEDCGGPILDRKEVEDLARRLGRQGRIVRLREEPFY